MESKRCGHSLAGRSIESSHLRDCGCVSSANIRRVIMGSVVDVGTVAGYMAAVHILTLNVKVDSHCVRCE